MIVASARAAALPGTLESFLIASFASAVLPARLDSVGRSCSGRGRVAPAAAATVAVVGAVDFAGLSPINVRAADGAGPCTHW